MLCDKIHTKPRLDPTRFPEIDANAFRKRRKDKKKKTTPHRYKSFYSNILSKKKYKIQSIE